MTSGVDAFRILANSSARAVVGLHSGSPAAFISHFDRSSCTWRRIVTCDSDDGEFAPEIRIAPRPSLCSFSRIESRRRASFSGKMRG
jgi:hypothetical protein